MGRRIQLAALIYEWKTFRPNFRRRGERIHMKVKDNQNNENSGKILLR